jgi:hypothetical protein
MSPLPSFSSLIAAGIPVRIAAAAGMSHGYLRLVVVPAAPDGPAAQTNDDLQAAFVEELRAHGGMAVVA